MMQKIIDFYKENWIGAAIAILIGAANVSIVIAYTIGIPVTSLVVSILNLLTFLPSAIYDLLATFLFYLAYATIGAFAQHLIMSIIRKMKVIKK